MKFTIYELRFTIAQATAVPGCRRRREESLHSFQFETRHLFSDKGK